VRLVPAELERALERVERGAAAGSEVLEQVQQNQQTSMEWPG
jgi:hypothetical protein